MGLKTVSFKFKNSSNYTQNLTLLNTCPPKSCSNTDYVTGQKIHRVASYSAYNSKLNYLNSRFCKCLPDKCPPQSSRNSGLLPTQVANMLNNAWQYNPQT